MKEIPLTQGKVALVDDADFEWLMRWKWYAFRGRYTFYAARNIKPLPGRGNQRVLSMHQVLLGVGLNEGVQIDHQDRNGLNNQRYNIRICTPMQQCHNRGMRSDNVSGFRGVGWCKAMNKWRARITINKQLIVLGYFEHKEDAAFAYQNIARTAFGEFCPTEIRNTNAA